MECPDRGELIATTGAQGSRKGRGSRDQREKRVGHLQETLKMVVVIDRGNSSTRREVERETRRCWRELEIR